MKLTLAHRPSVPASASPYRLLDQQGQEVAQFWGSFRTFRDLALGGLMLLDGLRSCELLALQLEDLQLADRQIRVLGQGSRTRVLPLPQDVWREYARALDNRTRLSTPQIP